MLASVQASGIKEISIYTMFLMYLNIFSFTIGFISIKIPVSQRVNQESISAHIEKIVSNKVFIILLILLSIYVYSLLVQFFVKIALYGSLYGVRHDFYAQEMYGPLFSQINAFVLKPMAIISMPLFGYMLFKKRNLVFLLMAFYLFGYESLGGGRLGYVKILLVALCIIFCLLRYIDKVKTKTVLSGSIIAVFLFFLLSIVSAARYGNVGFSKEAFKEGSSKTVEHIVSYTCGPIAAFDVAREQHFESQIGGRANGNLTLTSVINAINLVGRRVGFALPVKLNQLVEQKQENNIQIGNDIDWNALYTAVLFFYFDFGLLGVLIIPFLLGMLYRKLVKSMYHYHSFQFVVIVAYFFYLTMYSVMDFGFTSPYELIFLVFLVILGKRKKYALQ